MPANVAQIAAAPGGAETGPLVSGRWLAVLHVVLIAVVVSPLAFASYPPLVDYPNHLARIYVLANLADNPELARIYAANWAILPNLAMDAFLVPLAKILPIEVVGRLFVLASVLAFIGGTYALRYAIWGRIGLWPAMVLLAVYNAVLAWGFLNSLFGTGLALAGAALWIHARDRWTWGVRLPVFATVATVLFFAHLFALGAYGLIVGSIELERFLRRRDHAWRSRLFDLVRSGAQFAIPAVLLMMSPTSGNASVTIYEFKIGKLVKWFSMVMFHHSTLDAAMLLLVVFLVFGGMAAKAFRVAPRMGFVLLVLVAATIAMPAWLFGSWGADMRLPPLLAAAAIASVRCMPQRRSIEGLFAASFCLLMVIRVVDVAVAARHHDSWVSEFQAAAKQTIPVGSNVLVAVALYSDEEIRQGWTWKRVLHVAAFAVIDRPLFLPTLFTDARKQPLVVTKPYRQLDTPYGSPMYIQSLRLGISAPWSDPELYRNDTPGRVYFWADWPSKYDYVIVLRGRYVANPLPMYLGRKHRGSFFDIYRVIWRSPPELFPW